MSKKGRFLLFCLLPLLLACSKDTEDKLEGKWQLREITVDGQTEKIDTVFYNFQTSLFMYQIYDRTKERYSHMYGYKTLQENNDLFLELHSPADSMSIFLPRTDWESRKKNFHVDKVTGSTLILSSESKQYTFRKF